MVRYSNFAKFHGQNVKMSRNDIIGLVVDFDIFRQISKSSGTKERERKGEMIAVFFGEKRAIDMRRGSWMYIT